MVSLWCRKSLWEREDIFIQGINLNNKLYKTALYCRLSLDDGYSGLNFNRLWFQRLLQDIENKKINQKIINYILICKNMKELVNLKY